MINKELVKESIMLMGDFEYEELEAYEPFIDAAIAGVFEMVKDGVDENDPRIVQLAAAKAYKSIALCASESDGVTSFTAGSVSVTQDPDAFDNSEDYYANALADCSSLISDQGFAFLGV